jgi:hypothetical protein
MRGAPADPPVVAVKPLRIAVGVEPRGNAANLGVLPGQQVGGASGQFKSRANSAVRGRVI